MSFQTLKNNHCNKKKIADISRTIFKLWVYPTFNKSLFWVSLCLGDDGAFLFSLAVTWSGSCALVDLIYISIECVGTLDCLGRSITIVTIWTSMTCAGSSTLVYGSNATIELLVPKCPLPSFPDWVTGRPKLGQKKNLLESK